MFDTGSYEIRRVEDDSPYGLLTVGEKVKGIWPLTFVPVEGWEIWPLDLSEGSYAFTAVSSSDFPAGGPATTSRMSLSPIPENESDAPVGSHQINPGPFEADDGDEVLIMVGILDGTSSNVYSRGGLIQRSGLDWPFRLEEGQSVTLKYSEADTPEAVQAAADAAFQDEQVTRSLYERTP